MSTNQLEKFEDYITTGNLPGLNDLLAEIREERRQAEASSNVVDAQHGQEQATTQPPNVWVEAHAALSRI